MDFIVEHPEDLKNGDYSTSVALACSKKAGMNPRELAEKIKTELEKNLPKEIREKNQDVPIIFLTNMKDVAYTRSIEEMGFHYLVKADLRISEIVDKVKEKLGLK